MPLCFVWSLFFFSGTGLHSRVSTMYAWWFNYMCSTTLINCYLTSFNLFWGAKGHLRYSSKVTTYSNISNQSPQFLVCTQKDYCCCWVLLRPILDALNFILKRCTDNISTLDLAKQKEKKNTHTQKNNNNNSQAITVKDNLSSSHYRFQRCSFAYTSTCFTYFTLPNNQLLDL